MCPQAIVSQNSVASTRDAKGNIVHRKKVTMDVNFQSGEDEKAKSFLKKKEETLEKVRFQGICNNIESA